MASGAQLPTAERVLGEIPEAYSTMMWSGPVRVLFTDRRVMGVSTGSGTIVRSPSMFEEWKQSQISPKAPQYPESILLTVPSLAVWAVANNGVKVVEVRPFEQRDLPNPGCRVSLHAAYRAVRSAEGLKMDPIAGPVADLGVAVFQVIGFQKRPKGLEFIIPWSDSTTREFLKRTPLAPVVR